MKKVLRAITIVLVFSMLLSTLSLTAMADTTNFKIELFQANILEGRVGVKNENWNQYLVASDNVAMQTSGGWNGTDGAYHSPHDSANALYAIASSNVASNGGYAVFQLPIPAGQKISAISIIYNGRYCNGLYSTLYVSKAVDSGYVEISKTQEATSGTDVTFDLTEMANGWTSLYVKAEFPQTNCIDWSALYNIRAVGRFSDVTNEPVEAVPGSFNVSLFEPNIKNSSWELNSNWNQYLVDSNNVAMQTSAGWHGSNVWRSNNDSSNALYGADKSGGYATFELSIDEGLQIDALMLIVNARNYDNYHTKVQISDRLYGTYVDVFEALSATSGKDVQVSVSDIAAGWTSVYVKVVFPVTACADWNALFSIRAVGDTSKVGTKPQMAEQGFYGEQDYSVTFNQAGGASYVDLGVTMADLGIENCFTVECWIRTDAAACAYLVSSYDDSKTGFALKLPPNNTHGVQDYVWAHGTEYTTCVMNNFSPKSPVGQWQHVAMVIDGNKKHNYIYINGQLAWGPKTTNSGVFHDGTGNIMLGIKGDLSSGESFNGSIAEVRIWNDARSTEEITANYKIRLKGNEANLAGYWMLNETSGNIAYDSTANGNHGTLINATRTAPNAPSVTAIADVLTTEYEGNDSAIIFCTLNEGIDKYTVVEYGIEVYDLNGNFIKSFPAIKVHKEGKYGIALYGGDGTTQYIAKSYVKYQAEGGTIVMTAYANSYTSAFTIPA